MIVRLGVDCDDVQMLRVFIGMRQWFSAALLNWSISVDGIMMAMMPCVERRAAECLKSCEEEREPVCRAMFLRGWLLWSEFVKYGGFEIMMSYLFEETGE